MNISKDFVLEAMGRAEYLATVLETLRAKVVKEDLLEEAEAVSTSRIIASSSPQRIVDSRALELAPLVNSSATRSNGSGELDGLLQEPATALLSPPQTAYLVSHTRKFEVADLFSFLLGSRARLLYVWVLSGYMYGALWAYGTVFANSFSANIPVVFANHGETCEMVVGGEVNRDCLGVFSTWLAVFAIISIPLSCAELSEQVYMQVIMFAARVLVVLLMVGTVIVGWVGCGGGGVVFSDPATAGSTSSSITPPGMSLFSFSGLPSLLPVATYSFIFHHSVPVLAHPIADKRSLPGLFAAAFIVCGVSYGALGLLVSLGFGEGIKEQCNLNWQTYMGCVAPGQPANLTAIVVRFIVLIFPALDVLSAYPLNAITLGNNLQAACTGCLLGGGYTDKGVSVEEEGGEEVDPVPQQLQRTCTFLQSCNPCSRARGSSSSNGRNKNKRGLMLRIGFRLAASVPPILAGALSTASGINLDQILRWTGLIGVAIAFAIPSLLRAAAHARCKAVRKAISQAAALGDDVHALAENAMERPLTLREIFFDGLPEDGNARESTSEETTTPYTSWTTARTLIGGIRGDGVMALFSLVMAAYVFWGLVENKA